MDILFDILHSDVAKSLAVGLVGTGFTSQYELKSKMGL